MSPDNEEWLVILFIVLIAGIVSTFFFHSDNTKESLLNDYVCGDKVVYVYEDFTTKATTIGCNQTPPEGYHTIMAYT